MPLVFWHWLILGVGLVVLEALLPGVYLLWFGVAAIVTGLLTLPGLLTAVLPEPSWQLQVGVFAVLCFISVVVGRRVWKGNYIRK